VQGNADIKVEKKNKDSIAEPHHFNTAPDPEKNLRRIQLLSYCMESKLSEKATGTGKFRIGATHYTDYRYCMFEMVPNVNGKSKKRKMLQFMTFFKPEPEPYRV
jgi:hypothetical protein